MERRIWIVVGMVSLACTGVSPVFAGEIFFDPIYGVSTTSNIVYASGNTTGAPMPLTLDVYRPTNIGQGLVPVLSPAVVLQDGGAWTSASKDHDRVTTPAKYLAQRGFVVITANYRQIDNNPIVGTGPWNSLTFPFYIQIYPSANVVKAGIEDFAAAMTWTRANAATYGIDPNRVAAAGGSAGGIDALLLAYNNPSAAYAPQAVVALVSTMYGNHNLVDAGEPPAFLLNSKTDSVVLYSPDVTNLVNRMNGVGVYNEPWVQDLGLGVHDVDYNYDLDGENVLERMRDFLAYKLAGVVSQPALTGDYNNNGAVDASDYVLWRRGGPLQNELDMPGTVNVADYTAWRARFGNTLGSASSFGNDAVPEPATSFVTTFTVISFGFCRRKKPTDRARCTISNKANRPC